MDSDGVSALAVVARCPFEAHVWAGGMVVVCFCGVEEGDGAGGVALFEGEGWVGAEGFVGGMEGRAAGHGGWCIDWCCVEYRLWLLHCL